jgi:molybdopterin-guanine dinucleotide biosynthesis protein B
MHELQGDAAPSLGQLLRRLSPCDVVLIEGHKGERHRKIEIFREAVGQPPLYPEDPNIIAVASDRKITGRVAFVDLNDIEAVANLVCETAEPLESLLDRLE